MFNRSKSQLADLKPTTNTPAENQPSLRPQGEIPGAQQSDAIELKAEQHVSIISNDLTILGSDLKIISEGAIRVDGEIRGEIRGLDVTVGRRGKVIGTVSGKRVIIDGEVSGEIRAGQVTLRSNSRVAGDVHHQSLAIDLGAIFDGQSSRLPGPYFTKHTS